MSETLRNASPVYERQGFGRRLGFGAMPGLLLVDFVEAFRDPSAFGGGNIADAMESAATLLGAARERDLPVAHARIVFAGGVEGSVFRTKVPGLAVLTEHAPESQPVSALRPLEGELVVRRPHPSAFFGTGLALWLTERAVDTLLVAGCTTSGCVRATVVDAMSHGFRPIVVRECVGDRAADPHEASLFDMDQKYADVLGLDEALAALRPAGARRGAR